MGPPDGLSVALERTAGPRPGPPSARPAHWGARHLLPDFIIIGAARSGTTHLLGQLNAHPNVLPGPRETHFFDSHRYTYGLPWYRLRFPANEARREAYAHGLHPVLTGESSPSYLSHPQRARPASPAASRTSACSCCCATRPPRAASHWAWCLRQCGETRSFREAVEAEIGPPGDTAGLRIPRDKRPTDPLVVRRGIYQPQLERWQTHFAAGPDPGPPERALVPRPAGGHGRGLRLPGAAAAGAAAAGHAQPQQAARALRPGGPGPPARVLPTLQRGRWPTTSTWTSTGTIRRGLTGRHPSAADR